SVDYRWPSGDAECDCTQVYRLQAAALCQAQNGQHPQSWARKPTRGRTSRTTGDLLSSQPDQGRPSGGGLPREVSGDLSLGNRMYGPRLGGLPDVLCLSRG